MALASQTARTVVVGRPGSNGFKSPRRRRRQTAIIGAVAGVLLLAGVGLAWKLSRAQSAGTVPTPGGPVQGTPADAAKPLAAKPAAEPDKAKPITDFRMAAGKGADQGSSGAAAPVKDPLLRNGSPAAQKSPAPVIPEAPKPAAPAPMPPPAPVPDDAAPEVRQMLTQAEQAEKAGKLVDARADLNALLQNPQVREYDKDGIRRQIAELNETLVFSPTVAPGDPLTEVYKIVSGDNLVKLAKKGLAVEADLLQRVNRISDPGKLKIGQPVKLVHGPFHLVIHKAQFRADMYAGSPLPANSAGAPRPDGSEAGWVYIRSFNVGLGEKSGTPTGTFIVRQGSKMKDPPWTNPRTGEKFAAKDPKNPIGDRWLGLQGVDEKTKTITSYGVHGTIAPESIGKEMSMGCVRMMPEDIALAWEMVQGGVSVVRIVP